MKLLSALSRAIARCLPKTPFIFVSLFIAANATAGVLVAPTVVFMSDKNRTGRLNLENTANKPTEVSVYISFGLPISDTSGNVTVTLMDSNVTDAKSCMGWVKAFPRKIVIPANGSQVVRFVATPPPGLKDGEYWARVVVKSEEGQSDIPLATEEGAITTKLNMIMQTAIMMKYRSGDLVSKLDLDTTYATITDNTVRVTVDLTNKGNVSYVGKLTCKLFDSSKRMVDSREIDVAIYNSLRRRVDFPLPAGFNRPYSVEVAVTNKGRNDIAAEDMIYGNELFQAIAVADTQ
jgi:P pilus assembly chaperone PapD